MKNMKKILVMTLAALLLVAVSVAGTVAYLTTSSEEVTNIFEPTTVDVGVEESDNEYKLIPGTSISKDPKVTYKTPDFASYVFVKVTESIKDGLTFSDYIGYDVITTGDKKWTALPGEDGVYYMEVPAGEDTDGISVIQDMNGTPDMVTVKEDLTLEDMTALGTNQDDYPQLTFKSYIIQKDPFKSVEDAWANVDK